MFIMSHVKPPQACGGFAGAIMLLLLSPVKPFQFKEFTLLNLATSYYLVKCINRETPVNLSSFLFGIAN